MVRRLESLPVVDVLTEGFAKGIVVQGMLYEVLGAVGIAVNELVGKDRGYWGVFVFVVDNLFPSEEDKGWFA